MKIPITKKKKIQLLKAIKSSCFDTDIFPGLYYPSKVLTKEEAREFLHKIEKSC